MAAATRQLTLAEVQTAARRIVLDSMAKLEAGRITSVHGVPRGGLVPAALVAGALDVALVPWVGAHTLVVDDLVDSGRTAERYSAGMFDALFRKPHSPVEVAPNAVVLDGWLVFPWEVEERPGQDALVRLLQAEGLPVDALHQRRAGAAWAAVAERLRQGQLPRVS